MTQIPNQRHLFDIPEGVAYFNTATMGPMTKASVEAGQKGLARKLLAVEKATAKTKTTERFRAVVNSRARQAVTMFRQAAEKAEQDRAEAGGSWLQNSREAAQELAQHLAENEADAEPQPTEEGDDGQDDEKELEQEEPEQAEQEDEEVAASNKRLSEEKAAREAAEAEASSAKRLVEELREQLELQQAAPAPSAEGTPQSSSAKVWKFLQWSLYMVCSFSCSPCRGYGAQLVPFS